ncbi:conserved hypothetical protein [Microsporum canis CBS 113480]|uniref:Nascent polypeptide-associated complex subunit alpha-like UBA domain-containing protein n=1 Tax=Arthroderma otae (strain ATCC MYA-4605 / CBS 113480) TaxID=554155 RepID=C5FGE5_ARTOC|nr:conserved hypothetical protein [Microsporum canis CBS 113480]EEQ29830.1 conserved hypothetical protein [Microsporum canis CBS 113480]
MSEKAKQGSATPQDDNGLSAEAGASEIPTNAEDRAAAAALSSLNAPKTAAEADDADEDGGKKPSSADQEALGRAMSRLEMIAGGAKKAAAGGDRKRTDATTAAGEIAAAAASGEVVKKKPVKVAAEDVNLLVDQLDLTKIKATELLREHEGNAVRAIRAFILPPAAVA